MLSDEARQFFHERGYVWLQDLVDAMALQEELKPLHTEITGQSHPDGSISWRVERLWSPSEKRRKRREVRG